LLKRRVRRYQMGNRNL